MNSNRFSGGFDPSPSPQRRSLPEAWEAPAAGAADVASGRLRAFLNTELGAQEIYKTAIARLTQDGPADRDQLSLLRQIRSHHREHVQLLRQRLDERGEPPSTAAGDWALWDRALMSTASQFGGQAVLRALKESEEQSLADYRRAADELDAETQQLLWQRLIPTTERHVDLLDELLNDRSPAWM